MKNALRIPLKKKKEKKKETWRRNSRLMLSYHVISMDACLIRLTTVAGAQNKFMRSISRGYTWLHLQFCCSPIELRVLIQCQLSKRRRKICIYSDQAANAQHGSKIPSNDFICSSVTFCWFSLLPGKCWIHIDLNFGCFPQQIKILLFTSARKIIWVWEKLPMLTVITTHVQSWNRWGKLALIFWK